MVIEPRQTAAFLADAVAWCRTRSESALLRLVRSACSGVAHDVGAAYATLAARTGNLLEAIESGRLSLPASDRDAVLGFVERLRRASSFAQTCDDDATLREAVEEAFEIARVASSHVGPSQSDLAADDTARIDLCDAVEPEAPAGVRAHQRHFSASALNAYAECPRKWFYRYACSAVEDPGSSASAYGTAFHLALEDFHGEFPRPSSRDEPAMRERIADYVTWAFEQNRDGFETRIEFELQRRRAQRTAQRYVDWLIAQERKAPFTVIGREVPANLELNGHAFIGFIDRIDRDERTGGIAVVDYKTGNIATSAAEYREKVRKFADFQLPFYYWARTAAGDRVTRLALVPLKDALIDVRPVVLEVDASTVTDLDRARARMIEICDDLTSGEIERFEVATDPAACTYCAYATACSRKPPQQPERFAR